ncbi:MAG: ATP-dependent Clp protease ATP-binding subunit [Acidobacteria bacterium]|nr:ATP-dependent Clp protease ATP-binding subunit [Acidobacteriota bacterium]
MGERSPGIELAWRVAAIEAAQSCYSQIEPAHFLIGICSIDKCLTQTAMERLRLSAKDAETAKAESEAACALITSAGGEVTELRRKLRKQLGNGGRPPEDGKKIGRSAASHAAFERVAAWTPDPTLTHLLMALAEEDALAGVLKEFGVDAAVIRKGSVAAAPLLAKYGRDLTELARDGKLHPCIGRRDELLQMVRSLSRATKNNPLLIGEAGVGKTAIVEGLAWRIAQGKSLPGKRIVQLQIAELVSGTKYRGEFEERLMGILREAAQDAGLIVFIDEIHGVVGAGDSSGNMDAANIMKPALARGELRCIGATTIAEYRKYIEKDPALERRFQVVSVDEPSMEEAVAILEAGYLERFQKRHGVPIEAAAAKAAVALSARYLPDRRLPDKAIDLLDETCAMVAVPVLSAMPGEKPDTVSGVVTAESVAEVLSRWTGIPVGRMGEGDRERLQHMAEELQERVIGQDHACEQVSRVVQRARAGLKAATRPIGVLLFTGPTGAGKTELAKATAAFLFDSERAMLRIDMSEFMEKHSVSRLIGAPPGYIGHDEEGQLTGALRRTPYCVVLLDEVEKAHPDVLNLFLQVFDDGRLTDSKGRTVDATNALFILTSNVGGAAGRVPIGFRPEEIAATSAAAREEVGKAFRPEFVNRLDEVVVFSPLSPEDAARIVRLMLRGLEKSLQAQGIGLEATEDAVAWLCRTGYDPVYGARALRRAIAQHVEDPVADAILGGTIRAGCSAIVDYSDGALRIVADK